MNCNLNADTSIISNQKEHIESLQSEICLLKKHQESLVQNLNELISTKRMLSKVIAEYKLHIRRHKDSLYNGIEYILQKHGIFRQAYHCGDLNGISIRLLMSKADIIFEDVGENLISS